MATLVGFVVIMLMIAVFAFYWTTGRVLALLGRSRLVLAACVSLACWCAADAALGALGAALFGPAAQIDLFDLDMAGFELSLAEKFVLYAFAHALALAPRFWRVPNLART